VFCVSQNHAAKIAQILNEEADKRFPGKYQSDFALQVTSSVYDAQQFTLNFTNNILSGSANFDPYYRTSKTRVCVTVGMMTTGYDCPDVLNLALMRPIFSPTDFIQIKGRGTRKHNFTEQVIGEPLKKQVGEKQKVKYKLFDFFANCEYFEEEFDYDEVLKLPRLGAGKDTGPLPPPLPPVLGFENFNPDHITSFEETAIGLDGMRIDRMYFDKFKEKVQQDPQLAAKVQAGAWEEVDRYLEEHVLNKPKEYFTREKIRQALNADRRLTIKEVMEYIFGKIPYIKTKDELLDDEFDKFDSRYMPGDDYFEYARNVFKAYITDPNFRQMIDTGNFGMLYVDPNGEAFMKIPPDLRKKITEYIKDFVPLNQFSQ